VPSSDKGDLVDTLTRRFGSVLVLALTVLLAGLGGSAYAAVAGLSLSTGVSVSDSSNKTFSQPCPAGKQLLGGGAEISGAGQLVIEALRPDAGLTTFDVQGAEDEVGFAGDWPVVAYAICANPVSGLERRSSTSGATSSNKPQTVTCPAGKQVVGAGAEIGGGGGQVVIGSIRPDAALTNVTANGVEDENGFASNWTVTAYAVCGNIAGLELVRTTSPSDSTTSKFVTATCPAGKNLVGASAEKTGGAGQVLLEWITPNGALTRVDVRYREDENGFANNWSATADAICANASQRVTNTSTTSSDTMKLTTTPFCQSGKRIVGVGGDITGGNGQVTIQDFRASVGLDFSSVHAFEDDTGFGGNWSLRAYGVCTTPLPGQELVTAATTVDSTSPKVTKVGCPLGKQLVGMGVDTNPSGSGQVIVEDLFPNSLLTTVTVQASEDVSGFTGNWGLVAQAICADPVPGLELVSVESDFDSDPHSVTATCPAGKYLLGAGGSVNPDGNGQVVIDDLRPSANLRNVLLTGVEVQGGSSLVWNLTAHAICASP
jgi:hypothetical protein